MRDFYVSAHKGGLIQARHLIRALDEVEAERVFLRTYPQYRGMAIIIEGSWK